MVVVIIALAAAAFLAVGFVLQQRAASAAPLTEALSFKLLLRLLHRPLWLAGIGAMIVGQLLGGTAFGMGSLALVEPLLAVNLLFAMPLAAVLSRGRLGPREWVGAVALIAGLLLFVVAGQPGGGDSGQLPWPNWGISGGAIVAIAAVLTGISRRLSRSVAATLLAASAGILYGLQDALTRTTISLFTGGTFARALTQWYPYVLIAIAVVGMLLAQSAFSAAPLVASLPAITIAEPLTGIAFGVGVFSERLQLSPSALAVELVGLALMVAGVFLLARSPIVTMQPAADLPLTEKA